MLNVAILAAVFTVETVMPGGGKSVEKVEFPERDGVVVFKMTKADILARKAKRIDIVPDFAVARKGEAGYWFTPYGYYGEYDRDDGQQYAGAGRMSMPMFGWSNPRGAYLAIATSLNCFIRETVTAKKGEYRVAATLDEYLCSEPYEDLTIEYHRRPAGTSYAQLAKIYRDYQLKRGAVKPFRERFRENKILEKAILAPEVRVRQAWKPVPSPIKNQAPENEPEVKVAISFDRVKDIVREFKAQGVDDAEFCLVGWNIGGHDGRWPQYFPAEPKLGGDAKLKEAIYFALDNGYLIVPHGNFREGYVIGEDFDAEWVIKHKDGGLELYDGKGRVTWGGGQPYLMCPQRAFEKFCMRDIPRLAAFGFKGIGYFDVVTICEPRHCYDPRHPLNCAQGAAYWGRCAALSKRDLGGFASESGIDCFAGELDYSLYTFFGDPRDVEKKHAEGKGFAKRIVPVWQSVYNGIIANNPFTITVNATVKDRYSQLKALEFSARPTFYFYAKFLTVGANWMGEEDLGCGTDEELKRSVAAVKRGYDAYQPLKHLQLEFIEDHAETAPGVFTTTYSNGEKLVVDYNRQEWRLER